MQMCINFRLMRLGKMTSDILGAWSLCPPLATRSTRHWQNSVKWQCMQMFYMLIQPSNTKPNTNPNHTILDILVTIAMYRWRLGRVTSVTATLLTMLDPRQASREWRRHSSRFNSIRETAFTRHVTVRRHAPNLIALVSLAPGSAQPCSH